MEAYRIRKWNVQLDKIEQCKDKYKNSDLHAFNEGCRVQGHLEVNRVSISFFTSNCFYEQLGVISFLFIFQMAGSFHIAPGNSFSIRQFHIHDFQFTDVKLSHTINHLSFGDKIEFANTHPLDGLKVESNASK